MTEIMITETNPGEFGVEVDEGHLRTAHLVTVSESLVDDLGLMGVDRARLVRESVDFLLEREVATDIGDRLTLEEIPERHPEYYDELRRRLSAS